MKYKLSSVGKAINHKNALRTYLILTVSKATSISCLLSQTEGDLYVPSFEITLMVGSFSVC